MPKRKTKVRSPHTQGAAQVQATAHSTRFLADGRFKDQPDGNCLNCKWNMNEKHTTLFCMCPITHLSNVVCIQKVAITHLGNIDDVLHSGIDL